MISSGVRDLSGRKPPASFPLALIPWACFEISVYATGMWGDHRTLPVSGLLITAPFYMAVVALPAWLPLATARHLITRMAVLMVMTATAITAGISMAASHDAQAGLAVLLVPYVAIPLALLIWAVQVVTGVISKNGRHGQ